jgi:hypothetical protein
MNCAGQRGFLTLSRCDGPVLRMCSSCLRPFCSTHLSAQSGYTTCLDCTAQDPNVQQRDYDETWAHSYRRSYYHSTGYAPVYGSRDRFDRSDSQSFSDRSGDRMEDDREGTGFGAS